MVKISESDTVTCKDYSRQLITAQVHKKVLKISVNEKKNHGKDKTYFRMSHILKIAVHYIFAKI